MHSAKTHIHILLGLTLCLFVLGGCSGDQGKKEEKKTVTVQEQMGADAAQAVKKPLEDAQKAAAGVEAAQQKAQEAGATPQPVKEKKKLEGC
ncbi:MAG: hypothetical protein LBD10_11845 [Desulfobulbus sp.]|jgi:PBP1b-binding outer membrane lipoprotein LpoB|uniref:hypothetical protein n=1 Tax=Desulfobulbus sp. TaxID=895 RepID=UPI00283EAFB4|nr:hypothetical protein [Desulfobulbus sp.]MDR2550879.1 hypothetical protein [Desulfobulbus sp.]